jgi:hypothetical protein
MGTRIAGGTDLKEIAAVAKACGLPDFRYYAFAPVMFEALPPRVESRPAAIELVTLVPEPTLADAGPPVPAPVATPAADPIAPSPPPRVVAPPAEVASYPMLREVATALPHAAFPAPKPALSPSPRRKARAAGRVAMAAVGRD